MLQTAQNAIRRAASGRFLTRWHSHRAASDNVTQGTWIIIAVALAALMVALIAIPGSPVHTWLRRLTDSITSISS